MQRTTIMLPSNLKANASMLAHKEGISFGEFIREALLAKLNNFSQNITDPFFADSNYFTAKTPVDMAADHDQYLYGD